MNKCIFNAIKSNSIENMKFAIQNGASVTKFNHKGYSPLHFAISCNSLPIIEWLITNNTINIKCINRFRDNVIHIAVFYNHLEITEFFLKHSKVDMINAKNINGLCPIHIAVSNNNIEMVQLLCKYGADVNVKEYRNGYTPLHFAIAYRNENMVRLLVSEYNADVNMNPNKIDNTLNMALLYKSIPIAHFLLLRNVTVSDFVLESAIELGDKDILIKILTIKPIRKYNINEHLIESKNYDLIELLLKYGAQCNMKLFQLSIKLGYFGLVRLFLKYGFDVHSVDDELRTALHYAVINQKYSIVLLLVLGFHARIDVLDKQNETPLDIALKMNKNNSITTFLQNYMYKSLLLYKINKNETFF